MKNKESIYKITSIVLILDQMIKLWIQKSLHLNQQIIIIPHFFAIDFVKNTGAAFSILENNTILISIMSVIFILLLNHYIKKEESFTKLSIVSLGLILGGIFGNLIDRVIHHGVIDYLSFTIIQYNFPIFNLADAAIVIGVLLFSIDIIIEKRKESTE